MQSTTRWAVVATTLFGLLVAGGIVAVLNWNRTEAFLQRQTGRAEATLFRLGEVMSIRAELKAEYGTEPRVTYETGDGERVLKIEFSEGGRLDGEGKARAIAASALRTEGELERMDHVDRVDVSLGATAYSFLPAELVVPEPPPAL